MSRERDLLRKILDKTNYINYACNDKLRNEIMEFLFQPEQEPVAWAIFFDDEPNKVINEYLSQYKEDLEVIMQEGFYDDEMATLCPLYTAPPKREPLDDREISHNFRISKKAIHAESFWIGVKFAEKAHGIGAE